MLFRDEGWAKSVLANVSYYRLRGYWYDMQLSPSNDKLKPQTYFEDIFDRYIFDRKLKLILFDAIELIEIALRTKMIYHLSLAHGGLWYTHQDLFNNAERFKGNYDALLQEYSRSQEQFIVDHKKRFENSLPDAWKIMEVASFGTLSKYYKNLKDQLPQKAQIAKEFGLSNHKELSSWLGSLSYLRNIIAHHSRLWSRTVIIKPTEKLKKPVGAWFKSSLLPAQVEKPFLLISCVIYMCNSIIPDNRIKSQILHLIEKCPNIPIYKMGFVNSWHTEPIWQEKFE